MSIVGGFNTNYDSAAQRGGLTRKPSVGPDYRFTSGDDDVDAPEVLTPHEERRENVVHLARQLTRQSTRQSISLARPISRHTTQQNIHEEEWVDDGGIFDYEDGSDLDPYSPTFDVRKWTSLLMKDWSGIPRRAGVAFRNLGVHGFGSDADYQKTVGNMPLVLFQQLRNMITGRKRRVQILHSMDGVLDSGEMLVVLGPPGSGCTTMLKTIAGEMNGIYLDEGSELNYRGISPKDMHSQFRGEAIYTAEVDVHFPKLVVGDTLSFAARARGPRTPPGGLSHWDFADKMRDVVMAIFGISHTNNTIVGNDFIRGVSGGERKRVTIAEATLSSAPLQCWDNSTRGLDSANAIEFVKNLRMSAEYFGTTSVVAIYQAPQAAYDLFDKVSVLYEGEQIFFGKTTEAKDYFLRMGWYCPEQQTTPDFLTSLTSASERRPRQGYEGKLPTTPLEFVQAWKASPEYAALQQQITAFNEEYPIGGEHYGQFLASRRSQQAKNTRPKSPYTLSYGGQIKLCIHRGFQRLKADPSLTITQLLGNAIMALVISSVFYNLPMTTSSFYNRGGVIFFAILMNAFGSALEILTLYAQRPIVEKHAQYAFYHPSAEAFASMICDIPYKITNAIFFNLILYFMANLRREPGPFFFFFLTSFILTLTMSMFFRSIASLSRSLTEALTPAALIILALVIYTGFAIPINYMHGWARWLNYLDPIAYGFESLMVNEFHNREYMCSTYVPMGPGYTDISGDNHVCSSVGSVPGRATVNGDTYINTAYRYYHAHKWRNIGIIFAFMFFLMAIYISAAEFISAKKSKGEVLIYPRGKIPAEFKKSKGAGDIENMSDGKTHGGTAADRADGLIQRQTAVFSWKDVCYDIKIKGEPRRILDHVDGWVKPGTMTALMGVSGAGKTTLLDVLATRVTMGVVSGQMLVDGRQRDVSFQRKTGYVQQQDLHLETSTVREALRFSAMLRQPKDVPRAEKYAYVEEVLKLLEMDMYADAVVGVPGEGLNVEQRKRLTIGVELVAKPELLLFLDEPTSGLDSQTSWNILQLLQKLTANGQAILCTIHQPSAMLFEQFNRLLFLAKGGKTVYYGEVGSQSNILIDYFVRNGAPPCPPGENPAEWMLSAIGAAPGSQTDVDWHQAWLDSPERQAVRAELDNIKHERRALVPKQDKSTATDKSAYAEFAAPFGLQMFEVLRRVFQQYWRTPSYIWAKIALSVVCSLFIGFSFFKADTSQQGLQNQLFSIFMAFTIFGQLVQQTMPNFVIQRSLYEVRERPSKTYSWVVFILSSIIVEIPWSVLCATLFFLCWYYPIGYYRNAIPTDAVALRGALMWLYFQVFYLFTSTFSIMVVAGMELAETAGNVGNLLFSLCLVFCGVLVPISGLGWWKWMNRVSPFTYFVEGMLSTAVANTEVVCSAAELLHLDPPSGQTCAQFLGPWIKAVGGYLAEPDATSGCQYCQMKETNVFLAQFNIFYKYAWRDFGILWAYIIINIFGAIFFYWLARVPKKAKKEDDDEGLQRQVTTATNITGAPSAMSPPMSPVYEKPPVSAGYADDAATTTTAATPTMSEKPPLTPVYADAGFGNGNTRVGPGYDGPTNTGAGYPHDQSTHGTTPSHGTSSTVTHTPSREASG